MNQNTFTVTVNKKLDDYKLRQDYSDDYCSPKIIQIKPNTYITDGPQITKIKSSVVRVGKISKILSAISLEIQKSQN